MSVSNNTAINSKPCIYNCNTRIYWNASENAYFEVFSQKLHRCPNKPNNNTKTIIPTTISISKPTYYHKKPWSTTQPKPKMSNSFELLTGPIDIIQKKYEVLFDIVIEVGGKTHGSQSHIVGTNNSIQLIVYYEVPEGKRDEVKQKLITENNKIIL